MSFNHLQRGKACVNCRRRKMKCDGIRPICGQCSHANRADDCEYTSGNQRSRVQILEEDINRLEARIHELENPEQADTTSIVLHNPYVQPTGHRGSSRSNIPIGRAPSRAYSVESSAASQGPGPEAAVVLIDNFLPHSSEYGFFLDVTRFRQSALLPLPDGHHSRPCSALLSCVYLWGAHLSPFPYPAPGAEETFLPLALDQTARALSGTHPHRVMYALQAELLLAYYFFASGKFLQRKYHVTAAISLEISSGLNKVRSNQLGTTGGAVSVIPPPGDSTEEGERIRACWTGVILDKCWAVALVSSPNLVAGAQIDTPWPLEIEDYENGGMDPRIRTSFTVQSFLDATPTADRGTSTQALLAKASLLWERVYDLTNSYSPDMSRQESIAFSAEYSKLDNLMESFKRTLTPMHGRLHNPTPVMVRTLFVAHNVAHAACIQLHLVFVQSSSQCKQKVLTAARAIMELMGSLPTYTRHINPIMGTIWVSACQVLIDEILVLRAVRSGPLGFHPPTAIEIGLVGSFQRGVAAMGVFAPSCALLRYQVAKIQEACSAI